MTPSSITIQLLDGDHPLIRFPMSGSPWRNIAGRRSVSLETFEEAITLRDALSSFIAFHQGCKQAEEVA